MLPTYMYAKDDQGLYVNMFVGSTIKIDKVAGTNVEMIQTTDYPWSGKVAITVNPAAEKNFAIRVRSPRRSVSELYSDTPQADGIISMKVNGAPVDLKTDNGYVSIARVWKPGDKIELELPMVAQRVKCIDKVSANVGRVAIKYGPLVYSVEEADNQNMENRQEPVLAPNTELTTEWKPDLLGGVIVVKGTWADGKPLTAIPNWARNNRGGRSTVWIKDQ